jgi:L-alanine-DL-glutamate epimerase-like enolase superfamily enzyme
MYEAVLDRFPDAILEDPHDRPDVAALLEPHAARVSFDAPIATAADIATAPFGARIVNVKPSRIGGLRALLDVYEHCERNGVRMYGGGMGEVGVARGQIELLAALFHPDAPNDVAPSAYNLPDLPPGLPESPLAPPAGIAGFRWA